jgi:hypothetical protein
LFEHQACVADNSDRGLEVSSNLVGIDVNVDELGWREAVGHARQPGTGGAIVKASAERQNHVRVAACAVGHQRTVAASRAEAQRIACVERSFAERRGGNWNRHRFGKCHQGSFSAA